MLSKKQAGTQKSKTDLKQTKIGLQQQQLPKKQTAGELLGWPVAAPKEPSELTHVTWWHHSEVGSEGT